MRLPRQDMVSGAQEVRFASYRQLLRCLRSQNLVMNASRRLGVLNGRGVL